MILKIKGLERGEMIREEIRETQHPSSRGAISVTRHRNQLKRWKHGPGSCRGILPQGQELWEFLEQSWKKTKASQPGFIIDSSQGPETGCSFLGRMCEYHYNQEWKRKTPPKERALGWCRRLTRNAGSNIMLSTCSGDKRNWTCNPTVKSSLKSEG